MNKDHEYRNTKKKVETYCAFLGRLICDKALTTRSQWRTACSKRNTPLRACNNQYLLFGIASICTKTTTLFTWTHYTKFVLLHTPIQYLFPLTQSSSSMFSLSPKRASLSHHRLVISCQRAMHHFVQCHI